MEGKYRTQHGVEMEESVMVGKCELGCERDKHGRGLGDAGCGRDGKESDGAKSGVGRGKG